MTESGEIQAGGLINSRLRCDRLTESSRVSVRCGAISCFGFFFKKGGISDTEDKAMNVLIALDGGGMGRVGGLEDRNQTKHETRDFSCS